MNKEQYIPPAEEVKKAKNIKTFSPERIKSIHNKFEEMMANPEKTEEFYELIKNLPVIFTQKYHRNSPSNDLTEVDCKIEGNRIILSGYKSRQWNSAYGYYPKNRIAQKEITFQPYIEISNEWSGNNSFNSQQKDLNFYLSPKDKLNVGIYEGHQDTLGKNLEDYEEDLAGMDKNSEEYQESLKRYDDNLKEYEEIKERHKKNEEIIEKLGGGGVNDNMATEQGPWSDKKSKLSANTELMKFEDTDWKEEQEQSANNPFHPLLEDEK